jgi:hypothetical protein
LPNSDDVLDKLEACPALRSQPHRVADDPGGGAANEAEDGEELGAVFRPAKFGE